MPITIPDSLMVDGIRAVDIHGSAIANRSNLLVPPTFNKSKYVARWAFVGASAEAARLPQSLIPGYEVDGWQVWKDPKTDEICERPLGGKKAILLFRPKVLQAAVNAIYGNISRDRTIAEQQGRTVEGRPVLNGMLPGGEKTRWGYDPKSDAEAEPIGLGFNKIPTQHGAAVGAAEVDQQTASPRKPRGSRKAA